MTRRRVGVRAVQLLVLAVAYYAGAKLGLSLALYNSQVTPLWPPTGIAIAGFLLWGRSLWPAVAAAAFVVNVPLSSDLLTPALITVGNVLAPLAAVTLLRRLRFDIRVHSLADAATLVWVATASMLISATVGAAALLLSGLPSSQALSVWLTWWTGDAMGALVVAPFLLVVHRQVRLGLPTWRRTLTGSALLLCSLVAALVGFENAAGLRFLVFPVIILAAVSFQLHGAAPAALIVSVCATSAAASSTGPFAGQDQRQAMVTLTVFNLCVTFTSYLLAALTAERARTAKELAAQSGLLEQQVQERTESLTATLAQLAQAQRLARMASYAFDVRAGTGQWSEELYSLLGQPRRPALSVRDHLELCHPDDRALAESALSAAVASGQPFAFDHRLRHGDGGYRWLHLQGHVTCSEAGEVVSIAGSALDIDERKLAERRFQQLVEMAPDSMVFVDETGTITQVNQQAESLFGYARSELVGQALEVLIPERFRGVHPGHRHGFSAHPGLRPMGLDLDLQARRKDGTEFPVEISLSPLETDQGTLVSAAIRDVTVRKEQQEELAYRGLHDALTGLPNRLLLADRLSCMLAALPRRAEGQEGRAVSVLFLDLDRFKWVNDSLGHDAGDVLLRTIAQRLTAAVRAEDTVARFGGDEFVVLSANPSSPAEALAMAERLRMTVSKPTLLEGGHVVTPTLSIGVTSTCDPTADLSTLLRDADAAMYRAKDSGRDQTAFFAPEIHKQMSARLATAAGLTEAIEQGQLRVHYQPVMSLRTGAPVSVEALVRWQHPDRGLLHPGAFINLAEETGQIGAVDRCVIPLACREFSAMLHDRPELADLTLAVNVSLRHLSTDRLQDTLLEALGESGLRPAQLTVEVTESADLSTVQFEAMVKMVKGLGVKVAIDDFGTGFSALSRLSGLAIDHIKVDRSFVTQVHVSDRSRALVSAMSQLAGALDATVIAEGIEESEQASVLGALGCASGQGFLWSPGLPAAQVGELLTSQQQRAAAGIRMPPQPRSSPEEPAVQAGSAC